MVEVLKRIRGLKTLVFDAVEETTNLVQKTHESVSDKTLRYAQIVEPVAAPAETVHKVQRITATGVYTTIKLVNRGIDKITDAGYAVATDQLDPEMGSDQLATPIRSDAAGSLGWLIDSAEGALNGFVGDYLQSRGNELDLGMTLRHAGRVLEPDRDALEQALPDASGKVCIFVHGLSCTEWSWSFLAEEYYGDPKVTFGTMLSDDLGYTPLYVRYNSGRHISDNGEALSHLLSRLFESYPREIEEIVLIGHSMGGLVVRSAAHYAQRHDSSWLPKLRHVFSLGSPHLGAPLEKGANALGALLMAFDTPGTRVPAAILNARSAGIKDLRYGYIVKEEWEDADPDAMLEDNRQQIPFVPHAGYYFIAGTITGDPDDARSNLFGDLLVRLPSAAGHAPEPGRRIPFHFGRVFPKMHHFHLVNHPDVYDQVKELLSGHVPEPAQLDE